MTKENVVKIWLLTHIFSHYYNYELSKRLEGLKSLELVEKENASITLCFHAFWFISTLQFLDLRIKIPYNASFTCFQIIQLETLSLAQCLSARRAKASLLSQYDCLGLLSWDIYVTYPFLRYLISPIFLRCYSYPFKNHYFSK